MERMRRHRRSHRGAAGSAGRPHRPELARRGGDPGPVPTHPALPCLGTPPARRGGAGDRGRIHVPAARAAQPRDRRRSRSMRSARTGGPAGSGRLRLASAPALVAAAAAAPHSRPGSRHRRRLPRPFGPAPARLSNHRARHCARHRRDGRAPAPWAKFGKGRTRTLPPVGAQVPLGWCPGPFPSSPPLIAPRKPKVTLGRAVSKDYPPPAPGSSLPQKNRRDRVPNLAEIQGLVQTLQLPGRGAR